MRVSNGGPARIGAHMSIQGGLHRAVERAELVGATALQVFVKSARQWSAKRLTADEIDSFRARAERSGLQPYTLAHGSYLINLASPDAAVRERSIRALRVELERCARLGIPDLVLHPGSHRGAGEEVGLSRVTRALDRVLGRRVPGRPRPVGVLLETTAGQGTNLGHRFDQLAWILDRCRAQDRLGVCFDTCHALASGYEFRSARSYRETFREFDRLIGLDRLKGFHLNDSLHGRGSRKDRHQHIGRGEVGVEAFRMILNDRRFRGLPMVLETPKGPDLAEDRANLAVLRSLIPGAPR